ncbi:hypothetical protein BaRGS_00002726 [Batillaria attramentaria]|uniref:X-box-binding protein 1 n=1 Tax=Batillaria attramentaria TaxID=370345 RepID=A0ABD0M3R6_9CAEN
MRLQDCALTSAAVANGCIPHQRNQQSQSEADRQQERHDGLTAARNKPDDSLPNVQVPTGYSQGLRMMSVLPHKAIVITALGNKHANLQNPLAVAEMDDMFDTDGGGPRKRRRLTHLSPDEKILRRKLKNRVAAQTARDRKKALMSDLEEKVAKLQEQNKLLLKENAELRISRSTLQQENHRLKKCLSNTSSAPVKVESTDSVALSSKPEPDSPRSAAPAVSLPKEQIQALSRLMMHYAACALTMRSASCTRALRIGSFDLPTFVCWGILPEKLGFGSDALLSLLQELNGESGGLKQEEETDTASAATLCDLGASSVIGELQHDGSMVGPTPAELESLNELIKFDHIYYKEEPRDSSCSSDMNTPSNSVSGNLLHSGQLLPTLAPKGLESLRPSLVSNPASSVLVVSSSSVNSIATPAAVVATSPWSTSSNTAVLPQATPPIVSVPMMVDPNTVCGRVPVRVKNEVPAIKSACTVEVPEIAALADTDNQFDASEELLDFESLLGLTDLELASSFNLQDQSGHPPQMQQQQAVTVTVKGPTHQNARPTRKRKHSSTSQDSSRDALSCLSSSPVYGLDVNELTSSEETYQGNLSDSGISGDLSDAPSPASDMSSVLGDEDWQSSFTELFPSLM